MATYVVVTKLVCYYEEERKITEMMNTKEEALSKLKGVESLLNALCYSTKEAESDSDAYALLSDTLRECREFFEEN